MAVLAVSAKALLVLVGLVELLAGSTLTVEALAVAELAVAALPVAVLAMVHLYSSAIFQPW